VPGCTTKVAGITTPNSALPGSRVIPEEPKLGPGLYGPSGPPFVRIILLQEKLLAPRAVPAGPVAPVAPTGPLWARRDQQQQQDQQVRSGQQRQPAQSDPVDQHYSN
jgi:hypothetical protein